MITTHIHRPVTRCSLKKYAIGKIPVLLRCNGRLPVWPTLFQLIGSKRHFPFLSVSASTRRTRFAVFEKVFSFFPACVDEFL